MHSLKEIIGVIKKHLWLFSAIYLLPVSSTIGSCVLFRFHAGLVIALLIAFLVLVVLFCTVTTGRSASNWGVFVRQENPIRFWIDVSILGIAYVFVTLFPIAYALQESRR
jgi:hypothetical protein